MIAKTFSTITLRGLEDKPELVKIMNQVMHDKGINTGQAVIEAIIKDYAKKSDQLESLTKEYRTFKEKHFKLVEEKNNQIEKITEKFETLKSAGKAFLKAFQ